MLEQSLTKPSLNESSNMVDVVFELNGTSVPESYPFALWSEVVRCLPWLKGVADAGIIPLRGSQSGTELLLSKRSKLIIRIPEELKSKAAQLSGQQLTVDGSKLLVGQLKERPIQSVTTLHAYLVESDLGEIEFLAAMKEKLHAMNIACNLICDKHRKIIGPNRTINGFGLVLHDLKPQASIEMQRIGLGDSRHFGCGIFVPFKAISGLD